MLGLMQQHPLLISSLIEHAACAHPDAQIVSCALDAPSHPARWMLPRIAALMRTWIVVPGSSQAC
ncbi:hypothetical protein SBBP2_2990005 [Burkholderiales bacterium]|nr:hypothetical protein SBBP2_2990005 [Burkholderiales bacterium]